MSAVCPGTAQEESARAHHRDAAVLHDIAQRYMFSAVLGFARMHDERRGAPAQVRGCRCSVCVRYGLLAATYLQFLPAAFVGVTSVRPPLSLVCA